MNSTFNKYGVVTVLVIAVLIWSYGVYAIFFKPTSQDLPDVNIEIKEYSVGGKVVSIENNIFKINVGKVLVGQDGNYVSYEDKIIKIASGTPVVVSKVVQGRLFKRNGDVSDIKIDGGIVVFSNKNILKDDVIEPTRVEVQIVAK